MTPCGMRCLVPVVTPDALEPLPDDSNYVENRNNCYKLSQAKAAGFCEKDLGWCCFQQVDHVRARDDADKAALADDE